MTNEPSEYQLVLEFHDNDPENYDLVDVLEKKLEAELVSGEIDGHDVGGGIVNIFIITKEPKQCFEDAMKIISNIEPKLVAAAYRDFEEEDFVRLWPADDLTQFELK